MAWESDAEETQGDTVDRSKLMWVAIAGLFVAMAAFFLVPRDGVRTATRAKVHHIQIAYDMANPQAREEALSLVTDLHARLLAGENFAQLAEDYSHFADKAPVWVYEEDWPEELDTLIWTLPLNETSGVIQSQLGFHLIRVLTRELSDVDSYERELHERVLNDMRKGTQP